MKMIVNSLVSLLVLGCVTKDETRSIDLDMTPMAGSEVMPAEGGVSDTIGDASGGQGDSLYDPCANLSCGDLCDPCVPGEPCTAEEIAMFCDAAGDCSVLGRNECPADETGSENDGGSVPDSDDPEVTDPDRADPDRADPGSNLPVIDFSCSDAEDCEIKNVGNGCGFYPMCVNVDFVPNPDAYEGLAGVCGYPSVNGCVCTAGQCEGTFDPSMPGFGD